MSRVLAAFAVATATVACASASTTPKGWAKKSCDPAQLAGAPAAQEITVHMQWENEHVLDEAHSRGHAKDLAEWRKILAPTAATAAAAEKWLDAGLGAATRKAQCKRGFDTIKCKGLSPRALQALAGDARLCTFEATEGPAVGRRHVAVERRVSLPRGIHHVAGLEPLPAAEVMAPKKFLRTADAQLKSGAQGSTAQWPAAQTSAPQLLFVGAANRAVSQVLAAMACQDGSLWTSTTECSGSAKPTSFSVRAVRNGTAPLVHTAAIAGAMCYPAGSANWREPLVSPGQARADNYVCAVQTSAEMRDMQAFGRYELEAQSVFGTATSEWRGMVTFFNQQTSLERGQKVEVTPIVPVADADPASIAGLYGIEAGARAEGAVQGIVEFVDAQQPGNGFRDTDLAAYFAATGVNSTTSLLHYVGSAPMYQGPSGETTLDIELMMGIAPGAPTVVYNSGFGGANGVQYPDAFVNWASAVAEGPLTAGLAPSVWSISYGGPEWGNIPQMQKLQAYLKVFQASGITVFASTGDSGATIFGQVRPAFPSTSPYIVAVGATAINSPAQEQVVCSTIDNNVITSTGGYSGMFPRPAFQAQAVGAYAPTMGGPVNANRATPDVAMLGANIMIIVEGQQQTVYGTSASSPMLGALTALVNARRAAQGKPPLAYLHNLIYGNASTITKDVVRGNNCPNEINKFSACLEMAPSCYDAQQGWDASTGLGWVSYAPYLAAGLAWTNPAAPATPAPVPQPPTPVTPAPMNPPAPASGTFTQYICEGPFCVTGCQPHVLPLGKCLSLGGSRSALVSCGPQNLLLQEFTESPYCQGASQIQKQPLDQCLRGAQADTYIYNVCNQTTATADSTVVQLAMSASKKSQTFNKGF